MYYTFSTQGVCSKEIQFELDEQGKIHNVCFIGGCPGNLQAIAKLAEGTDAKQFADKLLGNDCGGKGTSCADQFAKALLQALANQSK